MKKKSEGKVQFHYWRENCIFMSKNRDEETISSDDESGSATGDPFISILNNSQTDAFYRSINFTQAIAHSETELSSQYMNSQEYETQIGNAISNHLVIGKTNQQSTQSSLNTQEAGYSQFTDESQSLSSQKRNVPDVLEAAQKRLNEFAEQLENSISANYRTLTGIYDFFDRKYSMITILKYIHQNAGDLQKAIKEIIHDKPQNIDDSFDFGYRNINASPKDIKDYLDFV